LNTAFNQYAARALRYRPAALIAAKTGAALVQAVAIGAYA